VLPDRSWTAPHDFEMPGIGKLSGARHVSLKRVAGDAGDEIAELGWTYALSFDAAAQASGVKVSGTLNSGDSHGTANVEAATGQIQSLQSLINMSGTVSVEIGGQMLAVPTKQSWRVTVEPLSELPDAEASPK
jgi:hypothetical protein